MTFVLQDKKSVESTCLCFARLVDNFQHEEVRTLLAHKHSKFYKPEKNKTSQQLKKKIQVVRMRI